MKNFFRAMGNSFLTIMVILLVVYGWAFIEMKLMLKSQPEMFGYVFYMQKENDMSPTFENNDVVIVKKDSEYNEKDNILYFDGVDSHYKIHEVASINGEDIITKCIECTTENEPISKNNVVGRVIGKVSFLGAIINFFKQKAVLILIAGAGITFLVISQVIEYKSSKEKKSLQNNE